jgi:ATP/maltotriose-dependent transcriptional regulator MalT
VSVATTALALATVRAAQGRDDVAERLFADALEGFRMYDMRSLEHWALRYAAQFLRSRGRDEEAAAYEARRAELAPSSTAPMV